MENAVKHGLCKKENGGTVQIRTERKQDNVYITVADDGAGYDPAAMERDGKAHVGISNVRSRLRSMCGGILEIESTPGKGTIAVITLPQKNK